MGNLPCIAHIINAHDVVEVEAEKYLALRLRGNRPWLRWGVKSVVGRRREVTSERAESSCLWRPWIRRETKGRRAREKIGRAAAQAVGIGIWDGSCWCEQFCGGTKTAK